MRKKFFIHQKDTEYHKQFILFSSDLWLLLLTKGLATSCRGKFHCDYENSPFDDFAIKATDNNGKTVGHLLMEISLITIFIIE